MRILFMLLLLVFLFQKGFSQSEQEELIHKYDSILNSKPLPDDTILLDINNKIAYLLQEKGDFNKAIVYLKAANELSKKNNWGISEAQSLFNLGNIYIHFGEYYTALDYLLESVKIKETLSDTVSYAKSYLSLGTLYKDIGNYDKSIEYQKKALVVFNQLKHLKGQSYALTNLGLSYTNKAYFITDTLLQTAYYDSSNACYSKALEIYSITNDQFGLSQCYYNIAVVYYYKAFLNSNIESFKSALEYYTKAYDIFIERNDLRGQCRINSNIATLYKDMADNEHNRNYENFKIYLNKALYHAHKCRDLSIELGLIPMERISDDLLADIYYGLEKTDSAFVFYSITNNMNNQAIRANFGFLSENEKELYFKTLKRDYDKLYGFIYENKTQHPEYVDVVLNNIIQNKGMLLKSSTAMRNTILSSGDTILLKEYEDWISIKKEIANRCTKGLNTDSLEEIATQVEQVLVKKSQEFSNYNKSSGFKWEEIKRNLKKNEAAIEFVKVKYNIDKYKIDETWVDSTIYFALVIKRESVHPEMVGVFFERDLQNIITDFNIKNLDYINSIYGSINNPNTKLYKLIWKPLEPSLKGINTVYLSPDGLLHKISFSAICKEKNVYLCDQYDIRTVSSTISLTQNENLSFEKDINVLIYGGINYSTNKSEVIYWPYLDGTRTETEMINKTFIDNNIQTTYITSNEATEEKFKAVSGSSNIIHIATHGFFFDSNFSSSTDLQKNTEYGNILFRGGSEGFGVETFVNNKNPLMRSGLVLAGANKVWEFDKSDEMEDGVLTAQEVAILDLRKTRLVVMSACETGLGDIHGSEGVYGLQRAFKMAGVRYIIMSLWQVADKETEEFMTKFYTKLLEIKDVRKAFSETKKELRQKYSPYFWAAFILVE